MNDHRKALLDAHNRDISAVATTVVKAMRNEPAISGQADQKADARELAKALHDLTRQGLKA